MMRLDYGLLPDWCFWTVRPPSCQTPSEDAQDDFPRDNATIFSPVNDVCDDEDSSKDDENRLWSVV